MARGEAKLESESSYKKEPGIWWPLSNCPSCRGHSDSKTAMTPALPELTAKERQSEDQRHRCDVFGDMSVWREGAGSSESI